MARVLVVDDEKLIVKGIRFSLEQDGMEVDCAYDGNGGWQLVQQETGAQMAVMTDGSDGLCENALAIVDNVVSMKLGL